MTSMQLAGLVEDFAHAVRIEALRRLGEILRVTEKAKGRAGPGRGKAGAPAGSAFTDTPTLKEWGLSPKQSSVAAAARRAAGAQRRRERRRTAPARCGRGRRLRIGRRRARLP